MTERNLKCHFYVKIHLSLESCIQHLGQRYVLFIPNTVHDGQPPPSKGNLFSVRAQPAFIKLVPSVEYYRRCWLYNVGVKHSRPLPLRGRQTIN